MNSILLSPTLPLHSLQSSPSHPSQPPYVNVLITTNNSQFGCISSLSLSLSIPSNSRHYSTSIVTALPSDEGGPVSVEDFMEKDWSFLDSDDFNSKEDHNQNISRIVSSARIEETSRVLVSIGSAGFVDRLLHTSPCSFLLVVHDSLFVLAAIKAKYDEVKCWQGELIRVPKKWVPLDVVFLYFLPALPFKLDQIFGTLAKCCSPGNANPKSSSIPLFS